MAAYNRFSRVRWAKPLGKLRLSFSACADHCSGKCSDHLLRWVGMVLPFCLLTRWFQSQPTECKNPENGC